MTLFKGAGVALVTPFHEDKSVNYEELTKILEFQIAEGSDAIITCGTTGEPPTMSEEERLSVIAHTVKVVAGRVPVIAGSGGNCTDNVISFSKKCQELGVDGLLVVTPYYNKCTQNGLYLHYKMVAESVNLPIIMYNVPSRTGLNMLPETAARLGKDCENIVGLKEACGDLAQVEKIVELAEGSLDIYSGNDDQIVPIMERGGVGVISVLSNIAPKETHEMVVEYLNGNKEKARCLQEKYLDVVSALFCEVNPIPVKKAMEFMGYKTKLLRMPLTEMEEENAARLKAAMEKVGL